MKKLFMMIVGLMCMLHAPYNLYVTNLSGTNPYSKSFEDRDVLVQHVMELLQNPLPQTLSYDEKKMMTNEKVLLCGEQKLERDLTKEELAEILPDTDPINLTETLKDISDHFIVRDGKLVNIGNPKFEIIPDSRMMPPDGSQFDLDAFVALSRGRIGQISIFVEKDRMGKVFRSGKLYVNQEILSNLLKQEIFAAFKAIMEDFNDI